METFFSPIFHTPFPMVEIFPFIIGTFPPFCFEIFQAKNPWQFHFDFDSQKSSQMLITESLGQLASYHFGFICWRPLLSPYLIFQLFLLLGNEKGPSLLIVQNCSFGVSCTVVLLKTSSPWSLREVRAHKGTRPEQYLWRGLSVTLTIIICLSSLWFLTLIFSMLLILTWLIWQSQIFFLNLPWIILTFRLQKKKWALWDVTAVHCGKSPRLRDRMGLELSTVSFQLKCRPYSTSTLWDS